MLKILIDKIRYLLIAAFLFCILTPLSIAQDYKLPMLDTLEFKQKVKAIDSAPKGQDKKIDREMHDEEPEEVQEQANKEDENDSEIEKNVSEELNVISLDEKIRKQIVQSKIEQFGYEMFNNKTSKTFDITPATVPLNYEIGTGDMLIVQLYGQTNLQYELSVNKEGKVLFPDIGPVNVRGLSYQNAISKIKTIVRKKMPRTKVVVSLGDLKSITVHVVGAVKSPGVYVVSGLSSILNALYKAGGVQYFGSLRNIVLRRQGAANKNIDLYGYLAQKDAEALPVLKEGDNIFVPTIGNTFGIAGEVIRPGIYEGDDSFCLEDLLKLAGGITPDADNTLMIERNSSNGGKSIININLRTGKPEQIILDSGDLVRVFKSDNTLKNAVGLLGSVISPGGYEYREGMRISNLINSKRMLRLNADLNYAIIIREDKKEKKLKVKSFKLGKALEQKNTKHDIKLRPRDQILIFNKLENRNKILEPIIQQFIKLSSSDNPAGYVSIYGNVRYPGNYPYESNISLYEYLNRVSGGIKTSTYEDFILVVREDPSKRSIRFYDVSLDDKSMHGHAKNFYLKPLDRIYTFVVSGEYSTSLMQEIERAKRYGNSDEIIDIIDVEGAVRMPGSYPYIDGMQVKDLIRYAGGVTEESSNTYIELTRLNIDGDSTSYKHTNLGMQGSIKDISVKNYILKAGDKLNIFTKPNFKKLNQISIAGEVKYPGKYNSKPGERLSHVIKRAGGLTKDAYLFGGVLTRESVRKVEQDSANRIQDNLDDILIKLELSPAHNSSTKRPVNVSRADLLNVIRQLKQIKAEGRLVVNFEKAIKGSLSDDVVIEDKDEIIIPPVPNHVSVVGEVFKRSNHIYRKKLYSKDYIDMSGGVTQLAKENYAYVVQPNGEILTARRKYWWGANNVKVYPGSIIYVPINLDRMTSLEKVQSWTQVLYQIGLSAASVRVLDIF